MSSSAAAASAAGSPGSPPSASAASASSTAAGAGAAAAGRGEKRPPELSEEKEEAEVKRPKAAAFECPFCSEDFDLSDPASAARVTVLPCKHLLCTESLERMLSKEGRGG